MSEWKKVKLGDILQVKKGEYITKKEAHDGIYPVILGGKEPAYYIDKYNHTGKAIVISRSGASAGYVSFWNEPIFVTDGFLIEPKDTLTYEFLYYALKSKQSLLHNAQKGAAIPHVTPSLIGDIDFFLPSADTQHRIATILSRYDSLIENYQKQIKLLEEAAQRLYKEWFVDLHFPGHENTNIVDGVPEGWTPSQLGQLVEFKRGKTITKKDVINGDIPVVAGGLEPAYYCNKSNTAERVITVSGSGANAGFTRMYFEKVWASDCSFVDASTTPFLHFVYCFLKDNKTRIDHLQKGAAQPHVYAKDINSLGLCIPIESILKSFEGTASKYFDTISSFQSQIHLLTEARDRLLPKLMGGEIVLS
ncbi:MAG: restriction endonuclease subunit S [Bacteroidales bacterium]|nr:restriction endonuclease subunit S [Bacteroidales bacterium]